jgi:hypothetical protein
MSSCGWFPMNPREIRAWLHEHPEALPRTLDDLAHYPMAFRRVMMGVVSPEVRAELWREHLATFLGSDSPFSPEQRELIAATIPELASLLAAPAPNPVMTEWEGRMSTVFSRQEAAQLFMLIGPPEPPEGIPLPPGALPSPAV